MLAYAIIMMMIFLGLALSNMAFAVNEKSTGSNSSGSYLAIKATTELDKWKDSNDKWHWDWDGTHSSAEKTTYYIYDNDHFPGHGFDKMPRLLLVGGLLCLDHDNDADDLAQGDETGTHNKLILERIYI